MKTEKCQECEQKNKLTLNTTAYKCRYCGLEQEVSGVVLDRLND